MVNQLAEQMLEQNLLSIAEKIEEQVDDKISKLENLDEDDLDAIRERRMAAMKKQAEKRAQWRKDGHGEYREIFGEKEFLAEMKGVERMICHFYRENWPCKVRWS